MALNKTVARLNGQQPLTELEMLEAELAELEAANPTPAPVAEPTELEALETELAGLEKSTKEKEAWYEDFGEGLGVSGLEAWYGMKDLVGQMDEEDKATLKDWQEDAAESGWGTAGRVTGELAQFMIPGGVALKGLKGVSALKNASKLKKVMALMGTEGAVAGAVGGTRLPGEGETRLGNVAKEGALGAVGAGVAPLVGRVLSKTVRGLKKSPQAEKLLSEGLDTMTPGQMAKSPALAGLESAAEVTPFLAKGTKAAQKRSEIAWNLKIMNDALPEGAEIVTEIGTKGAKQMQNVVKKAYQNAWQGSGKLSQKNLKGVVDDLFESAQTLGPDDAAVLKKLTKDLDDIRVKGTNKGHQVMDDMLRRRIKAAGSDKYDLTEALVKARDGLRRRMPRKTQEKLAKIDKKYPEYLTVRDAVGRAKQKGGEFTPSELTTSESVIQKKLSEIGEAATSEATELGRATLGRKTGGQPLEWFRRIAGVFPSPPGMETTGRTLMGQTGIQKKLLAMGQSERAQAIRELMSGGGAAAALFSE
jgi:hypothetical protein